MIAHYPKPLYTVYNTRYAINPKPYATVMDDRNLLHFVFNVVLWVIVPFILVAVIFLTRHVIGKTSDHRQKSAMKSGFWAGFLLFLMGLIYQVAIFLQEGFPKKELFQGFSLWLAIGSGLIGFFVFLGGKRIVAPSLSGITTLVVTFLAMYALLHYLLIRTFNELVLSLTLGIAFGVLTHFANPHSHVVKILKGTDHH